MLSIDAAHNVDAVFVHAAARLSYVQGGTTHAPPPTDGIEPLNTRHRDRETIGILYITPQYIQIAPYLSHIMVTSCT